MASFLKVIMGLTLLFLVSSCATTSTTVMQVPEKYMLDKQLERVKEVSDLRIGRMQPAETIFIETEEDPLVIMKRRDTITMRESSNQWRKVDNQSFLIKSTPSEYFLLVLDRPAITLMHTDALSFTLRGNKITAGSDSLNLEGVIYLISRIYKINSREEMYAVTNQILKKDS